MNKVIHILLIATVPLALTLLYFALPRPGQPMVSHSQWFVFSGVALVLVLGVFLPIIVRRASGLPRQPVSPSDLRFAIILMAVLCPLAFFAVWTFGAMGSVVITFVPLAWAFRSPRRSQRAANDRNA